MLDFGFYNMDCMDGMKQLIAQNFKADFLLTDIPYGEVNRESNGIRNLDKGKADIKTFDLIKFLPLADEIITGTFIIFCGKGQISEIFNFFTNKGYSTRLLVWEKNNPSVLNGQNVYLSGIETAVYAKKKNATFNGFCKNTVFRCPVPKSDIHPTQKPLKLWYELINDNTKIKDVVLDTCCGSGTTLVACQKLNRKYIGFEKDKDCYEAASKRLNDFKNQISMFDEVGK